MSEITPSSADLPLTGDGPSPPPSPLVPFRYRAQTTDQRMLDGTIDALDAGDARFRLTEMGLIVTAVEGQSRPRPKALSGDEFAAFNEQLIGLTASGMPVERGLRLIAEDMRSGRLAESVRRVADELEKGRPLSEAFAAHRGAFPPLYGRLIEAGVRAGNLPGMLMNVGRHLDLVSRLRQSLWHAMLYPLIVFLALSGVIIFIGIFVMPGFVRLYEDFDTALPHLTMLLIRLSSWVPWLLAGITALLLMLPFIWMMMRGSGSDQAFIDAVLLRVPLLGPVLRNNLLARWVDALHIAVSAGLDLPAAFELAGEAVGSPRLKRDGTRLVEALSAGHSLEGIHRELVPATVLAAIELAPSHGNLPGVLANMSRLYQQQAELRLGVMDVMLAPIMVIGLCVIIGFTCVALFLPLATVMQSVSA